MSSSIKDTQMKSALGKIILLFLLLHVSLLGSTQLASYKLTTNKNNVHIKEPLLISFKAKQENHKDNMFFSFNIQKSPDYEVKLLDTTIQDNAFHNTVTTFNYVLFALKEKTLHVKFNFIVRTASDKAVKQSYVDDHDDSIATSTYDTRVVIKPLTITVKKLTHPVDLVGDFTLHSKIDTAKINQYGAVNLHYILSGKGYKNSQLNILNKSINNVTIFSKINDDVSKLTKNGFNIKREYIYALTSKNNFTIPALSLQAYSPTKNKYYTLHTKSYAIKVQKIDTATLVDKTEAPKEESFINVERIKKFFIYVILFLSGFLAAKLSQKSFFNKKEKGKFEDIKNAKTVKNLLMILVMHYQNRGLDEYISKLDTATINNESLKLNQIKKDILKRLM